VNSKSFRAGESGFLRIENYGTVNANYGGAYNLANDNGEEVPNTEGVFSNIELDLPAGGAGACFPFKLPSDLLPGNYQFHAWASDRLRHAVRLTAQISVNP